MNLHPNSNPNPTLESESVPSASDAQPSSNAAAPADSGTGLQLSWNVSFETASGVAEPVPDGGEIFFERFQNRWRFGNDVLHPPVGFEMSDLFPNLRPICPLEWRIERLPEETKEQEGETGENRSRSPIYNEGLRIRQSRTSLEVSTFTPEAQRRVISTRSLRLLGQKSRQKDASDPQTEAPSETPLRETPLRRTFRSFFLRTENK